MSSTKSRNNDDEFSEDSDTSWDDYSDHNDIRSYDRYGGSWAQDVEEYSDDEIDTIFDGDPSAYWNID